MPAVWKSLDVGGDGGGRVVVWDDGDDGGITQMSPCAGSNGGGGNGNSNSNS